MSDLYHDKLKTIANQIGISTDDVLCCLTEDVPVEKQQLFEEQGIYQKLADALAIKNEGIYLCLIYKETSHSYKILPPADYIAETFAAINQEVTKYDYTVTYRCNNLFLANEDYYTKLLKKYPKAGIIYIVPHGIAEIAWMCRQFKLPLLLFDYHVNQGLQEFYTLSLDNRSATQRITKSLIDLGHRRIAHITGSLNHLSARERLEGYQLALKQAGINYNPDWVVQGNWRRERAEEEATRLLQKSPAPSAIVCANDLSAMGAYDAIYKAGLKIPEDISVTGFDDVPLSQICNPPLTTVHQPIAEIGKYAAQMMIKILDGEQPEKHHFFNNLKIIKRESIAPPHIEFLY